jgi:hypothetical protein
MPRRNRNAGTPRLDADQLATELIQLTADLHQAAQTGTRNNVALARYLVRTVTSGSLLTVTGGKQPIPHLAAESR